MSELKCVQVGSGDGGRSKGVGEGPEGQDLRELPGGHVPGACT